MAKIFKLLLYFLPWFLSNILFKVDTNFYETINKPFFTPPALVFVIIWPILYFLIALALYKNKNKNKNITFYKSLVINYFSNQIYTFLFFNIKSPFIAFIDSIIVFISSLFLYNETKNKYLILYIIWNLFITILSLTIYFMNI